MTTGIYNIKGKNNPINLMQSDFIAKGGEGSIYRKGPFAYKIYDDPTKMIPVKKIQELATLNDSRLIKPEEILQDKHNKPVGYSMRFVDNTYVICQLFPRIFRDRNHLSDNQVLNLVESMKRTVHFVHSKGILLVDLNEMNLLVTKSFNEVYFIDVDSYQTNSFPATAIMESVRDRHAKKVGTGWKWDENTDWFSFAVVTFQLFVGIHPYRGKHPMFTNPQNALDLRMDKNISVFNPSVSYPKNAVLPFSVIPKAYLQWYKDVFENGCRSAPPINPHGSIIIPVKNGISIPIPNTAPAIPFNQPHTANTHPVTGIGTFGILGTIGGIPITPPIAVPPQKKRGKQVTPAPANLVIRPILQTDVFDLTEIETYPDDIVNCFTPTVAAFIAGNPVQGSALIATPNVVVTKTNIFIDKKAVKCSANSVVGFTKTGQPIAARIDKGQLVLLQLNGRKKLDCDIKAKGVMVYNSRIYVQTGASIVEIQLLETSDKIVVSSKIVCNVLENATELYSGVSIQNCGGVYFASLFPQIGKCYQFKLPELCNVQLLDAKYDNHVLMILAKDRTSGTTVRFVFRFDIDFESYDCSVVSSSIQELNFVVSEAGICVCVADDTEIELFHNQKDTKSKRTLIDHKLPSGLTLYKSQKGEVIAAANKHLYKVSMKPTI